jgi:hypothetical protein
MKPEDEILIILKAGRVQLIDFHSHDLLFKLICLLLGQHLSFKLETAVVIALRALVLPQIHAITVST